MLEAWSTYVLRIGGLAAVGFDDASRFLLVVSASGRGVFDVRSGRAVARDHDGSWAWYADDDRCCDGVGPLSGVRIPMYGSGGAVDTGRLLPTATRDGFAVLEEPTGGLPMSRIRLMSGGAEVGCFEADEVRAFGFAPDERTMIVAESSGVIVLSR